MSIDFSSADRVLCVRDLQRKNGVDAFEAQRLMFAFVHFYRECIRLENFAVMNYQGFSKVGFRVHIL